MTKAALPLFIGFLIGTLFSPVTVELLKDHHGPELNYELQYEVREEFQFYRENVIPLADALSADRWNCNKDSCLGDREIMQLSRSIFRHSEETGVPSDLLVGILRVENPWLDAEAVSFAGAAGLFQIIPRYHVGRFPECGEQDVYSVEDNVCMGARIIGEYLEREQGRAVTRALLAYNGCRTTPGCEVYASNVVGDLQFAHSLVTHIPE